MTDRNVIVAMSGGVDSSVAALLLQQESRALAGMFMKNWEEDDDGFCRARVDADDARAVARLLDLPLHTRNFSAEYWDEVFEDFLAEYRALRTPNPDIACNREIKFKTFLDHALDVGGEKIATGHYARIAEHGNQRQLLKGVDAGKDQSYFLYTLGQEQLKRTLFPVGELPKQKVRAIAAQANLPVAQKKDSTGICFIGERDFAEFLSRYVADNPGQMVTPDGTVVGQHRGLAFYTIGQRQGLGIGGVAGATEQPWFVAEKKAAENHLVVVQGHDHPLLLTNGLRASQLSWIAGSPPARRFSCTAKVRYRQNDQPCEVEIEEDHCTTHFAAPQRAVTPGQSVVFYDGARCLGGGIIDEALGLEL